jgi:hypothetical protein
MSENTTIHTGESATAPVSNGRLWAVCVGNPFFTHTLFPVYVAVLVWGGLYFVTDGCADSSLCEVSHPDSGHEGKIAKEA